MIRESLSAGSHARVDVRSRRVRAMRSSGARDRWHFGQHRRRRRRAAGMGPPEEDGRALHRIQVTDGRTGQSWASDSISMASAVYVGIAVTSHNAATATRAPSRTRCRSPAGQTTNQPPTVTLTAPANGTSYTAPASIALAASASDPEGKLAKVEFYRGLHASRHRYDVAVQLHVVIGGGGHVFADGGRLRYGRVEDDVECGDGDGGHGNQQAADRDADGSVERREVHRAREHHVGGDRQRSRGQAGEGGVLSGSTLLRHRHDVAVQLHVVVVAAGSYSLTAVAYDTAGAKATSAAVAGHGRLPSPRRRAMWSSRSPRITPRWSRRIG